MKKTVFRLSTFTLSLFIIGLTVACSSRDSRQAGDTKAVTMYKNPGCICCTKWAEHMEAAGYEVTEKPVDNLSAIKFANKVPNRLGACHTAIIDGYVVEGHVPVEEVNRLLKEQPDARGIAVPGMPTGSPGMENPNRPDDEYDIILFGEDGSRKVYASY